MALFVIRQSGRSFAGTYVTMDIAQGAVVCWERHFEEENMNTIRQMIVVAIVYALKRFCVAVVTESKGTGLDPLKMSTLRKGHGLMSWNGWNSEWCKSIKKNGDNFYLNCGACPVCRAKKWHDEAKEHIQNGTYCQSWECNKMVWVGSDARRYNFGTQFVLSSGNSASSSQQDVTKSKKHVHMWQWSRHVVLEWVEKGISRKRTSTQYFKWLLLQCNWLGFESIWLACRDVVERDRPWRIANVQSTKGTWTYVMEWMKFRMMYVNEKEWR